MATVITSSFNQEYYLTSDAPDVRATTDKDKVAVSVSCENDDGAIDTFYATTLYAFDGSVELSDIGALVEEYFRRRSISTASVTFTIDDVAASATFIYCEYAPAADFSPSSHLLVAAPAQRIHQDSVVTVAAIDAGAAQPFIIKAVGRRADGSVAVVTREESHELFNNSYYFSAPYLITWALAAEPDDGGENIVAVHYFSIVYAGKQKLCFIVPAPAYLTFEFRNIFNVQEFIDIVGTITTKTQISHQSAVCNGSAAQYDREISRSFVVETEPIPSEEVDLFQQFLASHEIMLWLDGDEQRVIITDQSSEPSNDDGSLTTFKFTWRFANRRPCIFRHIVDGIMPPRRNVFNHSFSPEYD